MQELNCIKKIPIGENEKVAAPEIVLEVSIKNLECHAVSENHRKTLVNYILEIYEEITGEKPTM